MRCWPWISAAGFTLIDTMITILVLTTMMAMAVPAAVDAVAGLRLGMAARDVERELQTTRLRAVSANRSLRLRWNCPASGQYRIVEITGTAAIDSASNRCSDTAYPYPAADNDRLTVPNHDGPIQRLYPGIGVSGSDLQFFPNGTTQQVVGSSLQTITGEVTITVTKATTTKTIKVNGSGKIKIE